MKLPIASRLPAVVLCLLLFATTLFGTAKSEEGGYVPPRFMSGASNPPRALQQAAPLAGGPAAARGGQFMDVQGNSIVLPASYCQSCPGGAGGAGGGFGGAAGYGDPMAVDFGGYGPDQSGPHYFDVSLDTVFLQPQDPFAGVGGLIADGLGAPPIDLLSGQEEYEAGWRIAARYDLGPLSVLEATYMGLYDIGFGRNINSANLPNGLANSIFTSFSGFGIGGPIATLDFANVVQFNYESDLQSTEISYRRYWMGYNSRVTGTFLLGARYLRMTEGFTWDTQAFLNGNPATPANSSQNTTSENDLVGFQFGGDGWLTLRQGLRIGVESKAGVYNNRFKVNKTGVFDQIGNAPANFAIESEGNQVAFAAEGGVTMVADILPSWSIRGGYQVMYLSSLATVAGNLDAAAIGTIPNSTQGDALYHGFHGGLEYIW